MARNLARVPKANVMFGALLHTADRLRQGEELTELEEMLLGSLRDGLGEEEVREWGRVYRESVTARGTLVGVPGAITSRPVSAGYSFADLAEDLPAVTAEWRAQSNWSAVDHKALAAGEDFDSPEFIEGMREWGFAVTLPAYLAVPGDGQASQEPPGEDEAAAYGFRLEYENFHVHRQVGDGWPSTGDEIRWLSGGRSDLGARATPFVSQEFGGASAEAGRTTRFNANDPHLRLAFQGGGERGLILNVACWEWDTGDGTIDSVSEALIRLNNDPVFTVAWAAAGSLAPTFLGLLMDISSLAITVVSVVAKNDLSSSRTLYLDRNTLAALSQNGSAQWHFNGDGHHELKVKFTGAAIPYPTLQYAVRTGSTWGAPITLPFESLTPPALASYNGKLYALFVRSDKAVMWTRLEGQTWRTPERVGGRDGSDHLAPAVTVAHGKLYYAVTGDGGKLWWRTYTESGGWSPISQFTGYHSAHAPALAAHPHTNGVFLSHVGATGKVFTNYNDSTHWGSAWRDPSTWVVPNSIAMAPLREHLWRVSNGLNNRVYTSRWIYGQGWHNVEAHPTWHTAHAPALATHGDLMWIFMRGTDGRLYASTCDNHTWSPAETINGASPIDAPAAVSHDDKLYVMYRR
ncbi:hypothetical protein [Streptomyces sp. NPDC058701]|uniref:hypothetical protein n=1 Tax=Streptomyces sp. NPDC058701 TaxID=3346608 RepID=UPI0036566E2E